MTNKEYVRLQDMWLRHTGVQIGSLVKVARKAESYESGWNALWVNEMQQAVGKVCRVVDFKDSFGLCLDNSEGTMCFNFPFFVLEPAEEPKPEKYQFTPFEQVLVRDCDADDWHISLFEKCIDDENGLDFGCINGFFGAQCIPYAGHENLLGTADEPEDWAKYYDKE